MDYVDFVNNWALRLKGSDSYGHNSILYLTKIKDVRCGTTGTPELRAIVRQVIACHHVRVIGNHSGERYLWDIGDSRRETGVHSTCHGNELMHRH